AAERTHTTALCVDGLPDNVVRLVHVLRHFKPNLLFVRADLVPLLLAGPTAVPVAQRGARLVLSADGDTPAPSERASWERDWHGGISLLARCDAAGFIAAECPLCHALQVPESLYDTRIEGGGDARSPHDAQPGTLTVRARFLDLDPLATELAVRPAASDTACRHQGLELG
ncbi:MAG: hypothetical protein ACYDA6_10740, partial [Solirubrobacteraceae bacterium]